MTDPCDAADTLFASGFNCAQSVLAAFAPQLGLDESLALKLASPFGAGLSRRGQVCGAVTGALMTIGFALGSDTPAGKENTYKLGQDFLRRFEALNGSILCRELIGFDLSTPEGHQQARTRGVFTNLCPVFLRDAAEIAQAFLSKTLKLYFPLNAVNKTNWKSFPANQYLTKTLKKTVKRPNLGSKGLFFAVWPGDVEADDLEIPKLRQLDTEISGACRDFEHLSARWDFLDQFAGHQFVPGDIFQG